MLRFDFLSIVAWNRDLADTTTLQRGRSGKGFLEQLQSFAGENRGDVGESRDIPAGPREAINQPERNGITEV